MELLAPEFKSATAGVSENFFPELSRVLLRMPLSPNVIAFGNDGIIKVFSAGATMITGYEGHEVLDRYTPVLFHDSAEMEQRGAELSKLFGREISGYKVLVSIADAEGREMQLRTIIRKDFSTVRVKEWVEKLSGSNGDDAGYIMMLQPEPDDGLESPVLDGLFERSRNRLVILGDLVHGIRTPMNAVLGYAALLRESSNDQHHITGLDRILENGNALMRYVDDALEWAEMEELNLPVKPSPLEVDQMMEELIIVLQPELRRKSINLTWDMRPLFPREFMTDIRRFRKALEYLLRITLDRTVKGWVHLQFMQNPEDVSGFSVRLTAPSYPASPRLNGDRRAIRKRPVYSTAPGLLRALNATLEFYPEHDGREPFVARLNVRGVYADAGVGLQIRPVKNKLPTTPSIMLVDPHPANRDLLRHCLNSLGINAKSDSDEQEVVCWVSGLSESVSQIECRKPDLILVSVDLLNGIEPPAVWKKNASGIAKKRMIWGCVKPEDSGNCKQSKLDGLLVTPFNPAAIGRMISRLSQQL